MLRLSRRPLDIHPPQKSAPIWLVAAARGTYHPPLPVNGLTKGKREGRLLPILAFIRPSLHHMHIQLFIVNEQKVLLTILQPVRRPRLLDELPSLPGSTGRHTDLCPAVAPSLVTFLWMTSTVATNQISEARQALQGRPASN